MLLLWCIAFLFSLCCALLLVYRWWGCFLDSFLYLLGSLMLVVLIVACVMVLLLCFVRLVLRCVGMKRKKGLCRYLEHYQHTLSWILIVSLKGFVVVIGYSSLYVISSFRSPVLSTTNALCVSLVVILVHLLHLSHTKVNEFCSSLFFSSVV